MKLLIVKLKIKVHKTLTQIIYYKQKKNKFQLFSEKLMYYSLRQEGYIFNRN